MTITKAYLADQVRQKHGNLSRQEAQAAVDAIWGEIKQGLLAGQGIQIKSFGRFIVRSQAPRVGRNINAKQLVPIAARRVVVFRPSKRLKELLNVMIGA